MRILLVLTMMLFSVGCKKETNLTAVQAKTPTTKLTEPSWAKLIHIDSLIPGSYISNDKMQVIIIAEDKKTIRNVTFRKVEESIDYSKPITKVKHTDGTYELKVIAPGKVTLVPSLGAEPIDSDECREIIANAYEEFNQKFGGNQFVFQSNGSFVTSHSKALVIDESELTEGSVGAVFGNSHIARVYQKSDKNINIDEVISFYGSTELPHICASLDPEQDLDSDGFKGAEDKCPKIKGSAPEGCPFELSGFVNNCDGQAELASKLEKRFKNKVVKVCESEGNFKEVEFVCHKDLDNNTLEWVHQSVDGVDLSEFANKTCIHIDSI